MNWSFKTQFYNINDKIKLINNSNYLFKKSNFYHWSFIFSYKKEHQVAKKWALIIYKLKIVQNFLIKLRDHVEL